MLYALWLMNNTIKACTKTFRPTMLTAHEREWYLLLVHDMYHRFIRKNIWITYSLKDHLKMSHFFQTNIQCSFIKLLTIHPPTASEGKCKKHIESGILNKKSYGTKFALNWYPKVKIFVILSQTWQAQTTNPPNETMFVWKKETVKLWDGS